MTVAHTARLGALARLHALTLSHNPAHPRAYTLAPTAGAIRGGTRHDTLRPYRSCAFCSAVLGTFPPRA